MKNAIFFVSVLLLFMFFLACNSTDQPDQEKQVSSNESMSRADLLKHGEYLVTIVGCDHCHTPKKMTAEGPVPDMSKWLMGHPKDSPLPPIDKSEIEPGKWILLTGDLTAAVGPWGVSFAANLTPHETGLGNWTFENFKKSLTEGKHKGLDNGRMVMPPMPWQSLAKLKAQDLEAIYEYLKTIKPIDNLVPEYIPPPNM